MGRVGLGTAALEALLARHWWRPQPSALAQALQPLAWLYGRLARGRRVRARPGTRAPVPVLVVGNIVAGGAGKTPTVIALVQALRAAGRHPGVISRGHGRRGEGVRAVSDDAGAAEVGDEPLLIRRRAGVPVWIGRDRSAAAQALCRQHPEVDVLVADDGLQHHALARDAELLVFDRRGTGNGLLLPAGPLREPLPQRLPATTRVLYTDGQASTPLEGVLALRHIASAWPLAAWQQGDAGAALPLAALRGRRLLAVAGLAAPQRFFAMLEALGLTLDRLPLPDHHAYDTLPWPVGTALVVTTEKDATKLDPARVGATQVWVVPLDLVLPAGLVDDLLALLPLPPPAAAPPLP